MFASFLMAAVLTLVVLALVGAVVLLMRENTRLTARLEATQPTNFEDVGAFHAKFALDNATYWPAGPRPHDPGLLEFRQRFLREELTEFDDASDRRDDAKAFDALLDLVYVAMGTAHLLGYPWQEGWAMVQRANMAKERAAGADDPRSIRRHAADVVKPAGWAPPDIDYLLRTYGWPEKKIVDPATGTGI